MLIYVAHVTNIGSDAAGKVTGRRFLGVHWDPALPPEQAAEKAGAPVAWTSIATIAITPLRRRGGAPDVDAPASLRFRGSASWWLFGRGLHNRLEDFLRISIELSNNCQELHDIYSTLSPLVIGNKRVRFTKALC